MGQRGRAPRWSPTSTEPRWETAACTQPRRRSDQTRTLPAAPTGQREPGEDRPIQATCSYPLQDGPETERDATETELC